MSSFYFLETNSSLKKFLEDSLSMTPEERAKYLETYEVSIVLFTLFENGIRIICMSKSFGLGPVDHLNNLSLRVSLWSDSCCKKKYKMDLVV